MAWHLDERWAREDGWRESTCLTWSVFENRLGLGVQLCLTLAKMGFPALGASSKHAFNTNAASGASLSVADILSHCGMSERRCLNSSMPWNHVGPCVRNADC